MTWASADVFPGGEQRRHFAHPFQVVDDVIQMDVHKTLYPFYTTKKRPQVMATVAKTALRWQQCFFTHTSFHTVPSYVAYRYEQSLSRCFPDINFI